MGILVIREKVTPEQLREMLEVYTADSYIKLAVDTEREFLVGGAVMHYECEEILLEQEQSEQRNVWGAGWYVDRQEVAYDSYINQRPGDGNRSIYIEDESLKSRVKTIVETLFAGVQP
jgi:Protein of unknown function (DUF5674)